MSITNGPKAEKQTHPHAGGRTACHHATSPLLTSPQARPLVSALYPNAAPARYPPNHPQQAAPRAMYRVCAPCHCCTRTCRALRSRCSAEGGVAAEGGVHSQPARVERVTHCSLLAVRRCLAGCVCAQLKAAGRRVVRGGGTCSHPCCSTAARLADLPCSYRSRLLKVEGDIIVSTGGNLMRRPRYMHYCSENTNVVSCSMNSDSNRASPWNQLTDMLGGPVRVHPCPVSVIHCNSSEVENSVQ
jgi:hypothetical protein